MNIKHKKRLSKKSIIIALTSILLLSIVGFFIVQNNQPKQQLTTANDIGKQDPENKVDYGPPTKQQVDDSNKQKDEIIDKYENPPTSSSISVVINRARQADAGQPLDIRATVTGTTSGTCAITLTKSGQPTVEKNFSVTFEATSSSCSGASVPAAEFGASGDWNLSVIVRTTSTTSAPATQTVTIAK